MDAFEIGYALAFPAGLVAGLAAMGADFEVLDAASAAAGDDVVLAAGAFEPLRMAWAPDEVAGVDGDAAEGTEEPGALAVPAAGPGVARRGVDGGGRIEGKRVGGGSADAGSAVGAGRSVGARLSLARSRTAEAAGVAGAAEGGGLTGPGVAPRDAGAGLGGDAAEAAARVRVAAVEADVGGASGGGWSATIGAAGGGARGGGVARLAGVGGVARGGLADAGSARVTGRSAAAYSDGTVDRQFEGAGAAGAAVTARVSDLVGAAEPGIAPVPGRGAGEAWRLAVVLDQESAAPGAVAGARAGGAQGAPMGALFEQQAVAPQELGGGRQDEGSRPVILDGRLVGHWLSERMARDAARPGAGTTFFDPRQAPAWTPSGVL